MNLPDQLTDQQKQSIRFVDFMRVLLHLARKDKDQKSLQLFGVFVVTVNRKIVSGCTPSDLLNAIEDARPDPNASVLDPVADVPTVPATPRAKRRESKGKRGWVRRLLGL